MAIVTKRFHADGSTCESCNKIIARTALKVHGVKDAEFDYSTEEGIVTFDTSQTSMERIFSKIEEKGYSCRREGSRGEASSKSSANARSPTNTLGFIFMIIGVITIGYFALKLIDKVPLPEMSQNMGLGLVFVLGLLTGFHCIGMCGGFVLAYTTKTAKDKSSIHAAHASYAIGKTLSYTLIGAVFGLIGSIIAFTPALRGWIGIVAGIFLIFFGMRTLNIIPALRRISLTPKFLGKFVAANSSPGSSPLIVGFLNGLMLACGPLQAMYILAAGTGSWLEGAKIMLVFGLGTLPVMIIFGYAASIISVKTTTKIVKVSGVIVIFLGLIMMNNGLSLLGKGYDFKTLTTNIARYGSPGNANVGIQNGIQSSGSSAGNTAASASKYPTATLKDGYQEIHMTVTASGWAPDTFILKKGVPVHWVIDAQQITNCNRAIQVPKYSLQFNLKPGLQTIEFTPTESGTVPWSCWMGMIPGTFIVQDDIGTPAAQAQAVQAVASAPAKKAGGCGCGGGAAPAPTAAAPLPVPATGSCH